MSSRRSKAPPPEPTAARVEGSRDPGPVVPPPAMRKASLDAAGAEVHGRVRKESLALDGVVVTRVTFGVGARWSEDVAPKAGTPTCLAPHVAIVLSGALRVRMDDGTEEDFGRNDVMLLPPGHDAWTLGDTPCVFVELSQGYDRYGPGAAGKRERFG